MPTMSKTPLQPATILCPGQGAQHVGMGRGWFEQYPVAARTFAAADEALGFSLSRLCFEGPEAQLNRTDNAQLAIYTASVACYRALRQTGVIDKLAATAGLSLGEFTALYLAGAFNFIDGLKLVRLRGQAMQEAADAVYSGRAGGKAGGKSGGKTGGQSRAGLGRILPPATGGGGSGMVALVGADEHQAVALCEEALNDPQNSGDQVLVPANFNCPGQVVVSGSLAACTRALAVARKMQLRATPLAVAGAFHSPLMQPAADRLAEALETVSWRRPAIPVLSNVTAQPHEAEAGSIKQRLVEQLTNPVRWSKSMRWAIENTTSRFIELAPGKVLSGLMRRIDRRQRVENFAEPG